ncbi:MAG: ribose-phosphate pyrophosphokinase [Calditrichaeota bacterium]|nr:ribose-phosphate pyrophosphokinase [Calditrichota bacterium]MCB9367960.1 ribose-phosphate pyrophosphokinase [Calditrichota bacterium]
MYRSYELKIFSGTAHRALGERIAASLGLPLGEVKISRFSDGEIGVQFEENIRGRDVFLVQPTCPPAENLLELLIMVDAAKRASAGRITAVIPYYGYARQDRKDGPRVAITSRLVADLLQAAGIHRILTMDLHAPQIQGFFNIPFDHLMASRLFIDLFTMHPVENLTIVAPDVGSTKLARFYANYMKTDFVIVDKHRTGPNQAVAMNLIGDVRGKNCLIVDDIVDTAGTLAATVRMLKERGALDIYGAITHPVLSGQAVDRIESSDMAAMWVTDSLPTPREHHYNKIRKLSTAKLFAGAIQRIHEEESISHLFLDDHEETRESMVDQAQLEAMAGIISSD